MFDQITSSPDVLGGKPHLKGTRISVEMVLEWLASGATLDAIATAYPHLSRAALEQAIRYAARFLENEIVIETDVTP